MWVNQPNLTYPFYIYCFRNSIPQLKHTVCVCCVESSTGRAHAKAEADSDQRFRNLDSWADGNIAGERACTLLCANTLDLIEFNLWMFYYLGVKDSKWQSAVAPASARRSYILSECNHRQLAVEITRGTGPRRGGRRAGAVKQIYIYVRNLYLNLHVSKVILTTTYRYFNSLAVVCMVSS